MSLLDTTPSPPPAELQPPNAEAAARFYGVQKQPALEPAPSAAVQAVRDSRGVERSFYPVAKSMGTYDARGNPIGPVRELAMAVTPRASDADLARLVPELATIASDAGMDKNDVGMLAGAIRKATSGEPLTEAQVDAKQLEVIKAVRAATSLDGPGAFDRVWADAKAIATRDPRMKQILDRTGAFNDVRVAMRFVELGKAARSRGEFNKR